MADTRSEGDIARSGRIYRRVGSGEALASDCGLDGHRGGGESAEQYPESGVPGARLSRGSWGMRIGEGKACFQRPGAKVVLSV